MISNIIYKILVFLGIIKESNYAQKKEKIFEYEIKDLMTKNELVFFKKMEELKMEYEIIPQVNLATIINKKRICNQQNKKRNSKYKSRTI